MSHLMHVYVHVCRSRSPSTRKHKSKHSKSSKDERKKRSKEEEEEIQQANELRAKLGLKPLRD